ncbi:BQ2448_1138 [Microbotryum intermedium]|uniref:galacturonan 1,4-alpha-galacturonidase n=1 Tax=Microbotryum intermedium TaxID=269621 RepID=A0A238FCY9_9BASI|nr:BQ2448_1138 [Microbotryum intermedium]
MKGFLSSLLLGALFAATAQAAPAVDKEHQQQLLFFQGTFQIKTLLVTPHLSNVEIFLSGVFNYTLSFSYWSTPTLNPARPGSYNLVYQNATTFFLLSGDNVWFHGDTSFSNAGFYGNGQVSAAADHYSGESFATNPSGPMPLNLVQPWWDQFVINKAAGNSTTGPLFARPIMLAIGNSTNMVVENLNLLQGPFWNIFLGDSHNVTIQNININAVSASKYFIYNTDGIDVYRSSSVKLFNWNVNNGDDCVSLKPNSTEVEIGNMVCNGSHDISVGSLGQYRGQTDIVKNVYIHNISMSNAQAGARIKVWPNSPYADPASGGGLGYVKNITFENFVYNNVDDPLIITSCYNYQAPFCAANPSLITISDVNYVNVTGTSSGKINNVVGVLDCSNWCRSISAKGTDLRLPNISKFAGVTPVYNCTHVRNESPVSVVN